ncbi:hypothetical protein [Microvirga alba]|uniref:Uncharacterized protein n=1 Tax=Microvirga alba TaxID=2791025 RepID=A0A931FL40_9HYPH|nr:hypothetical protein [Microvirga alba]MBF9231769.1 hypothetical protein [Microvirga alba]
MLTEADLKAPASLLFETVGAHPEEPLRDWSDAKEFASLREAVHWAMNAEAPAGKHAIIRAASGYVLRPEMLEGIWASLQGP